MAKFENMHLFVKPGCPYCAKVDRFLDEAGIEIEHRSVADPANADELVRVGGKLQSPCLVIDGKPMYESDDIIAYLREMA